MRNDVGIQPELEHDLGLLLLGPQLFDPRGVIQQLALSVDEPDELHSLKS